MNDATDESFSNDIPTVTVAISHCLAQLTLTSKTLVLGVEISLQSVIEAYITFNLICRHS